jgi:hypothetical protein
MFGALSAASAALCGPRGAAPPARVLPQPVSLGPPNLEGDLVAMEAYRRSLLEQASGDGNDLTA